MKRAFVLLLFIAVVIILQVFFSKSARKWPGLVLPIIAFLLSLLFPLNMVVPSQGATAAFLLQLCLVWVIGNIPTMILLAIYFACQGKQRRDKQSG